jgi:hypothetical protein
MGYYRLPLNVGYTLDFPIIQYANDTLLIMEACPQQLFVLKFLLNTFADSTGLKVNYSKSSMVPINLSPERLSHLAATFNYVAESLSFTYLTLSLSNSKPTIQECLPFVHMVERRLLNTSMFLTHGGKLLIVNSVLSSLPTFFMCSIKVPIDILEAGVVVMLMIRCPHSSWRILTSIEDIVYGVVVMLMIRNHHWLPRSWYVDKKREVVLV